MKMRLILTGAILCLLITISEAQSSLELLNYSRIYPGATARSLGVAGAFGAVGADQSAIGINPAGLGIYRRNELMGTVLVNNTATQVTQNNSTSTDNKLRLQLGHVGFVYSKLLRGNSGIKKWMAANFGITISRVADFNTQRSFHNTQSYNSYLSDFRDELNFAGLSEANISYDNFSQGVVSGYYTYLLNPTDSGASTYVAVTDGNFVDQKIRTRTKGGINELAFSIATNYNHKVYLGLLIGVPIIDYDYELLVTERDLVDTIAAFNSYTYTRNLQASGAGINVKLGVIYKPVNAIRLGAAIHSPTYYRVSEAYSSDWVSELDTLPFNSEYSSGEFDYGMSTAWKAVGSAAVILKKIGFVSFDYEYANFALGKYHFDSDFSAAENSLNNQVQQILNFSHTYRVGVELAPKSFRLRGGFAYSTSPLKSTVVTVGDGDFSTQTFSAGIGLKKKVFFVDLTYYRTTSLTTNYIATNIETNDKLMSDNVVLSAGFTF